MIELPKLPKAITRDETEHGKLYYTREQMYDFAKRTIDLFEAQRQKGSKAADDLAKIFGFTK